MKPLTKFLALLLALLVAFSVMASAADLPENLTGPVRDHGWRDGNRHFDCGKRYALVSLCAGEIRLLSLYRHRE